MGKRKIYGDEGYKIAVIGGGTGLSVILRGLKNITENLAAVVSVADDGGGSGFLRSDLGMLPPGDVRSCLLALADMEGDMQELFQYRFAEGMLKGQNVGNLLLAALNGMTGSFSQGVAKAHDIFRIKGNVIPVTNENVILCARLADGSFIKGESNIPVVANEKKAKIDQVFLYPEHPRPLEEAIEAILRADMIILGPGSVFTSIIPNLLVDGIVEALENAKAPKVLICNVMTQPGETEGFGVCEHIKSIGKYLGKTCMDYVIVNSEEISPSVLSRYVADGAQQVKLTTQEESLIRNQDIELVSGNFVDIKHGFIRHDADKIANVVFSILNA